MGNAALPRAAVMDRGRTENGDGGGTFMEGDAVLSARAVNDKSVQ